jgi:glucose-1-phosphate cytidylyltransferase
MKVVLFCGGLGTRLREYSETIPKPMVPIGHRPMLWHLMKYYAHYGHTDFVLCLGYRGDLIRQFFLTYDECMSNDFELSGGGREIRLYGRDIQDWRITFADTGLHSNIGQRLSSVEKYLEGEDTFMANYSDGLSDLPLDDYVEEFRRRDKVASFLSVRPSQSFHVVATGADGLVSDIRPVDGSAFRINGGFFIFKKSIFDYMRPGEELVQEPFQRLIAKGELLAHENHGFWAAMDTFKDKQRLDDMEAQGKTPWAVWKAGSAPPVVGSSRSLADAVPTPSVLRAVRGA